MLPLHYRPGQGPDGPPVGAHTHTSEGTFGYNPDLLLGESDFYRRRSRTDGLWKAARLVFRRCVRRIEGDTFGLSKQEITRRTYRVRFLATILVTCLLVGLYFLRSPLVPAIAGGTGGYREAPTGSEDKPDVGRLENTDPPGAGGKEEAGGAQLAQRKDTDAQRGGVVQRESLLTLRSPSRPYKPRPLKAENDERRRAVRDAFVHAWKGYRAHAWGHDEIQPVTNGTNDSWGKFAVTMIDALDTLIIMGLDEELAEARAFVATLNFCEADYPLSFFETTIRHLGGLLSAYDLTRDILYLDKARELADCLMPAFNSDTGIPYHNVVPRTGVAKNPSWSGGSSLLAEAGSIQLEFKYLSHVTGSGKYAEAAEKALDALAAAPLATPGLYPLYISPSSGKFTSDHVSFGAMGDSFYEYLLKQQLLFPASEGARGGKYRRMYDESIGAMSRQLVGRSQRRNLAYIGEMRRGVTIALMDHLACYVPGMLALGAQPFALTTVPEKEAHDRADSHMSLAKELARTCATLYEDQPTGIGPESVRFSSMPGADYTVDNGKYILRPETIESLFVLHRLTGEDVYREQAWSAFKAIERHCRTPAAFSGLHDVTLERPSQDNSMQSFFMAETLKYLYLVFGPADDLPLNEYVFTTEAHPLGVVGLD